ncbi:hypothetical protein [Chondrinema litorale]|uniref:hypothetical protein n=1 Tax=Chondrinema litorale TaxID=2994555 RepID=UPI0025426FAE|nr:hypothetical protein [Chondrinema litorale]UZR93149.1 hypothetical protein OQ292_14915 [Chondrinema litorale]
MSDEMFWQIIEKNGIIIGAFYVIVILFTYQMVVHREKLTKAFFANLFASARFLNEFSLTFHMRYRNKIEQRVSSVYTYMNMLLKLTPVRVHIMKFKYVSSELKKLKEEKDNAAKSISTTALTWQHYRCWIIHETVTGFKPIKQEWDGINIAEQSIDLLITQTIINNNFGVYVPDVDKMPNGDFKEIMQHYGVRAFYSKLLHTKADVVYTMLVTFNRENPLEDSDIAFIKICAGNCERLMFN